MSRSIPSSLKDVKKKIKKLKGTRGKFQRIRCIRSIYLALNRETFDELPLKVVVSAFKRIPILIEQIYNMDVDEKYVKVINTTFSKFTNKYNKFINILVEKTCLVRHMLGYDLSRVVCKLLDYE